MADTQMQRKEIGGVKELVILVGILLTVIAGAIGTYWVHSQGVEAAGTAGAAGKAVSEPTGPRAAIPAPPAGVFHADVYFDFKSTRLRADAAVGACRRRFKNLPERHFRSLELLVRQHLERRPPTDMA